MIIRPYSRIVMIVHPSRRIVENILPDEIQGFIVADDVFVIIPLPDGTIEMVFPHPFGHADFETANHRANGF